MNYKQHEAATNRKIRKANVIFGLGIGALALTAILVAGFMGYYAGKHYAKQPASIDLPEEFAAADSNSRFLILKRDTSAKGQVVTTLGFSDDEPIEPGFYFSRESGTVKSYSMETFLLVPKDQIRGGDDQDLTVDELSDIVHQHFARFRKNDSTRGLMERLHKVN